MFFAPLNRAKISDRKSIMNNQILSIIAGVVSIALIEIADAAELINLRYGQNAASAGSLSSLPAYDRRAQGIFRPRRTAT